MVVLPVKRLAQGKSRLRATLPPAADALPLALAADTATAALACAPVLVVTSDEMVAAALRRLGATIAAEPDTLAGLNAAIAFGGEVAASQGYRPVAITADLPAMRPADLGAVLARLDRRAAFVPDRRGDGTTLLAAAQGAALRPRFGPNSAMAHRRDGASRLSAPPRLRHDVDTEADLVAAIDLGVGRHTAAVLASVTVVPMQATVARYDMASRSGTVLLDDGGELSFDAAAFARSGLRLLRLGQRVRLDRDATGTVIGLSIPTMS